VSALRERFPAPAVMGVVNVTPDSFSDGGLFLDAAAAVEQGLRLAAEGAALLDVGGESTRPGSEPVTAQEEAGRVIPVIERLAAAGSVPVSVDTRKAEVAREALAAGATMVNDVTALRHDPAMAGVIAETGADVCLMHMLGEPRTMQDDPRYADVVGEVTEFLAERAGHAESAGIPREAICLDPGIGFGKTVEHNLALLRNLDRICALGYPVLLGVSRKRFIAAVTGETDGERLSGTIAANVLGLASGASIFRVHEVRPNREALDLAAAVLGAHA
jgi:dihydropteroate synthase